MANGHDPRSRSAHERRAIEQMADATQAMQTVAHEGYCDANQLQRLIQANRAAAQARTHLVSIGARDSKRTKRLWGALGKLERRIKTAGDKTIAECAR